MNGLILIHGVWRSCPRAYNQGMKRKRRPILASLLLVLLSAIGLGASAQDEQADKPDKPDKLELKLDPKVLVFIEPLREDGTVDYIAALNNKYREGVTKENNAFRGLFLLLKKEVDEDDVFDDAGNAEKVAELLDVTQAERDASPHYTDWYDYAEAQGIEFDRADELYEAFLDDPSDGEANAAYLTWLALSEPAFVRAGEMVKKSKYWAPLISGDQQGMLISVLLPQLGKYRSLAKGLQSRALYAAATGDQAKAMDSIHVIGQLAYHTSYEPMLISVLVANSLNALAADTVHHLLDKRLLSEVSLKQLDQLWRGRSERRTIAQSLSFSERCTVLDAYMQIASGRHGENGFLDADGAGRLLGSGAIDVNRGLKQISQHYFMMGKIASIQNYAGRERVAAMFEEQFEERIAKNQLVIEVQDIPLPNLKLLTKEARTDALTTMLLTIFLPAISSVTNSETRYMANERCTFIAIACERYRLKHGELPETLNDLVPVYLDAVPIDPYDEKPLRYKATDQGFIVYSVGENLKDDGGLVADPRNDGDRVIEIKWDHEE